jgi:hypothetical protein
MNIMGRPSEHQVSHQVENKVENKPVYGVYPRHNGSIEGPFGKHSTSIRKN